MTLALFIALTSAMPPAARLVIEDPAELPRIRDNLSWISLADRRFDPKEIERWFGRVLDPFDPKSFEAIGFDSKRRVDVYVGAAVVFEGTLLAAPLFDALHSEDVALSRVKSVGRVAVGRKAHDQKELARELLRAKPRAPACAQKRGKPSIYGDGALEEAEGRLGQWFSSVSFAIWLSGSDLETCFELVPRASAELALGIVPGGGKALPLVDEPQAAARAAAHLGAEGVRRLATRLGATPKDASVLGGDVALAFSNRGLIAAASLVAKPTKEKALAARAEALDHLGGLIVSRLPGFRFALAEDRLVLVVGAPTNEEALQALVKKPALDAPISIELSPPLVFEALQARALRGEAGPSPMALSVVRMGFGAFIDSMRSVSLRAKPRPGRLEVTAKIERAARP